jgi:purine-binding chemotaxis protein CheW
VSVLEVELGERQIALRTEDVREVLALTAVTPVPLGPPMLIGLTQLRGQILPVVDLVEPARAPKPTDQVVIVEHGEVRAALLVDRVLGIRSEATTPPLDLGAIFQRLRARVRAIGRQL